MRSVLLVDDQALFRGALCSLLTSAGWQVVGEAADGAEALEVVHSLKPDLVLMGMHMTRRNGLEATRLIKEADANAKVVILTASDDEEDLLEALKTGASGYMLKSVRPELLFELLEGVFLGEAAISPAVATVALRALSRLTKRPRAPGTSRLTRREKDILHLVARGSCNRDIATALKIAESTVKNYLRHIMVKLHVNSRGQAAAWAMRAGIIPPEDAG